MLTSLASHYGFDIDTPFEELSSAQQQKVLFGSGTEEIAFNYVNDRGNVYKRTHTFEGIIPNMERRYRETESQTVREDLAKFQNTQSCPECSGQRLNKAARHVFIDEKSLPEVTALSIGGLAAYYPRLPLDGHQAQNAEQIYKETRDRLQSQVL